MILFSSQTASPKSEEQEARCYQPFLVLYNSIFLYPAFLNKKIVKIRINCFFFGGEKSLEFLLFYVDEFKNLFLRVLPPLSVSSHRRTPPKIHIKSSLNFLVFPVFFLSFFTNFSVSLITFCRFFFFLADEILEKSQLFLIKFQMNFLLLMAFELINWI